MASALRRFFTRRGRPVADPVSDPVAEPVTEPVIRRRCPCTNPDEEQLPVVVRDGAPRGEFELPTAGDVEWLLLSYT